MGCFATGKKALFRVYSPKAAQVTLELFHDYNQTTGEQHPMQCSHSGIWQVELEGNLLGMYYGYRITPPPEPDPFFEPTDHLIADPYSLHVTTRNHYRRYAKTLITRPDEPFDWQGDDFVAPPDPRDLVIYEAHLRDMTAHPKTGARHPGTYRGFLEDEIRGGINHLKRLGVNAVEFLPLQSFAAFEPPYYKRTEEGVYNTWNPYSRNHWGYMTSFFFAPETIYSSDDSTRAGAVTGLSQRSRQELKTLVRELHREGIAVIMDVVYNHASQYDLNPLRHLDKGHYFRLNKNGNYRSESGTGNDLKTESPRARKLIVESVCYWMRHYHIDGFRFDLANLIDQKTLEQITHQARRINPNVLLIAEPWGEGYDPTRFSELGWSSWNDRIRNGVKGVKPGKDHGFIFNDKASSIHRQGMKNLLCGTLLSGEDGLFHEPGHSINYLESHDGYTLGDFIRIGLNSRLRRARIDNRKTFTRLNDEQARIARLAALTLFVSQGVTMIHQGQEWARSKVIALTPAEDPHEGQVDNDSYEKDNETNWLDYSEIRQNPTLFAYYQGLIRMRLASPALRKSPPEAIMFHDGDDLRQFCLRIHGEPAGDPYDYLVYLNGNHEESGHLELPGGFWELIASAENASEAKLAEVSGTMRIFPCSGVVLRQLRV